MANCLWEIANRGVATEIWASESLGLALRTRDGGEIMHQRPSVLPSGSGVWARSLPPQGPLWFSCLYDLPRLSPTNLWASPDYCLATLCCRSAVDTATLLYAGRRLSLEETQAALEVGLADKANRRHLPS